MESLPPLEIAAVRPDRLSETLLLAFSSLSPAGQAARVEAVAQQAEQGTLCLEAILQATRRGRLVGAVYGQPQAGRSALVWPPVVMPDEPRGTRVRLLDQACRCLSSRAVALATLLFDSEEAVDEALAIECGFTRLATIGYLISPAEAFPDAAPRLPFEHEMVLPWHVDRWGKMLERTYQDTLDCPGLEGMRSIHDVIDGYLATGAYRPEFWNIVRNEDDDVGCLILADHAEQNMSELAYMGLAPEARSRGWGRRLARWAQWLARLAGRERLLVGVDLQNEPARRAYFRCGFQEWDRKVVFVRRFGAS